MANRRRFILPTHLVPMTEFPNWFYWQEDENKKKVPAQALRPGRAARVNDPKTWCDFQDACDAFEDGYGDGLGFVLKGSPIAALDLEDCILKGGAIAPWAKNQIARAKSYVEFTPSGKGLRILGLGDEGEPVHIKRSMPDGGFLEVYFNTSRYVTVTGGVLHERPLAPLGAFLDEIRSTSPAPPTAATAGRPSTTAQAGLIDGFREVSVDYVIRRLKHPPILQLMGQPDKETASQVMWKIECEVRDAAIRHGLQDHPHLPLWIAACAFASESFRVHCVGMSSEARVSWLERAVRRCLRKGGL